MSAFKNIPFKKIGIGVFWTLIGAAGLFLLVSAIEKKSTETCSGYEVNISGVNNHFFVSQKDVVSIIEKISGKGIVGKKVNSFPLLAIEKELKEEPWISNAELFFDKNNKLVARIEEKNPVARVFRQNGTSFYIDHDLNILPKSGYKSARLPVFTGFQALGNVLIPADSNLLKEIGELSLYIQKDSFMNAMLDQIDISSDRTFILIPKLGDQRFVFGNAKNMEEKFRKLKLFYEKVIPLRGWNAFHKIDLQYKDQIVASIKGREEIVADSMKTLSMMQAMADMAQRMSGDTTQNMIQDNPKNTTDVSLILQSFSRDDMPGDDATSSPVPADNAMNAIIKPAATNIADKNKTENTKINSIKEDRSKEKIQAKPKATAPAKNTIQPKATTIKQNDY